LKDLIRELSYALSHSTTGPIFSGRTHSTLEYRRARRRRRRRESGRVNRSGLPLARPQCANHVQEAGLCRIYLPHLSPCGANPTHVCMRCGARVACALTTNRVDSTLDEPKEPCRCRKSSGRSAPWSLQALHLRLVRTMASHLSLHAHGAYLTPLPA